MLPAGQLAIGSVHSTRFAAVCRLAERSRGHSAQDNVCVVLLLLTVVCSACTCRLTGSLPERERDVRGRYHSSDI
jgi:hypothetical protein